MHKLSQKTANMKPLWEKYLYIAVWTQHKHSKLKLNLRLTPYAGVTSEGKATHNTQRPHPTRKINHTNPGRLIFR